MLGIAIAHTSMHSCRHTCIHAYMHTCIHACIHAYMHTCIHACMHACMHTYIHTYIHIERDYINIHTGSLAQGPPALHTHWSEYHVPARASVYMLMVFG